MDEVETLSLEQIRAFGEASEAIQFQAEDRQERYRWVEQTLRQHGYGKLGGEARGLLRRWISKITGLSRAQLTRLIASFQEGAEFKPKRYRRHRFALRYTPSDIDLPAMVDEAHETLSGPATRKRLRQSRSYRNRRIVYQPTRPTQVAIGERRRPDPQGRPGYLRGDTVHQGDQGGTKGLYHINAVDEVTQWEVAGACPVISEA